MLVTVSVFFMLSQFKLSEDFVKLSKELLLFMGRIPTK